MTLTHPNHKHCNPCGKQKPLDQFYTHDSGKPRSMCKACHSNRCAERARRRTARRKAEVREMRALLTQAAWFAEYTERNGLFSMRKNAKQWLARFADISKRAERGEG